MKPLLLFSIAVVSLVSPARAQSGHHHDMKGMQMGSSQPPAGSEAAPDTKPAMDMSSGSHGDHAGHEMAAAPDTSPTARGTDLPAGDAAPPPLAHDRSADRFYGAEAMAAAEARLMGSHGGTTFHQIMFNLAEYQARKGRDGFRWAGEAWMGGDINRLVFKTEGEGAFGGHLDALEGQVLYSRALDPYWNFQLGVRQDLKPGPARTYATIGVEGLAPYWFETEAALFLSNKGDLLARLETYYDQRLTQRLVLQPRAELSFAAQDVPENGIGSGLSDAELGLRLRYEIRREFAPYIGVSWDRKIDRTARLARAAGGPASTTSFVAGIRVWF